MPPKQPQQHGSSQASSSHHAAGPTHSYYDICKHLADNIRNEFSVGREMSAVIETEKGGSHPSVTLWVQARNHRDPDPTRKNLWVVVPHPGLVYEIQRLVRRGFPDGPKGSRIILTDDMDESTEALFQFRENKDKNKTDKLPTGAFIPEPEPPNVIIRGPDHHLASVAEFLFKDVLFETWEARKADRKFHAANKWPKYSLMFSETYWMVKDGKRTKKVNIGLYLCKDELYKGKDDDDVEIILNKGLLESLLTTAKNGPGEPGLRHLHKGHFMWQLIEDVKNNFKPEELLNDSSSSSSSTSPEPSSSSSGASPGPGPGPGPGPSQKRGHSRSGSDAADSKKPKVGTSQTFGSRAQGTSGSGSNQPSGSSSHSASTSAPHTSSQHSSQHSLSQKVDKHLKI